MPAGAPPLFQAGTAATSAKVGTSDANTMSKVLANQGTLTRAPQFGHERVRAGPKNCFCQYEKVGARQRGHL